MAKAVLSSKSWSSIVEKHMKMIRKPFALGVLSLALLGALPASAQVTNFWGNYDAGKTLHTDVTKPAVGRSYFTTKVEEAPGGVKLIIDMYHGTLNVPTSLSLQAAINDGTGKLEPVPFFKLDQNDVVDNSSTYHSHREYTLTYDELNKALKAVLPPGATHITIGPGSPLLVLGKWPTYGYNNSGHTWGGLARGGIIYMPDSAGTANATTGVSRAATDLDIGYPIAQQMVMLYGTTDANGKIVGLKQGGQIKSRLEAEGKYQIALGDSATVTQKLFAMSKDRAYADRILGTDWSIEPEMKYMKKDPKTGQLLLDQNGLPTPDPMVDTYYDSKNNDGAKSDIAIRYRWTEQNGEGAWNFKPGLTNMSKDGVVNRIEYGVETTDDKPETVKKFADSNDPLNPFKLIRTITGKTPSDFLHPNLKITDTRYKFKLKNKAGLVIEVSVDNVHAISLRNAGHETKYVQVELDVDHPSAQSANVAKPAVPSWAGGSSLADKMTPDVKKFVDGLSANAFLDGRPVIHTPADLSPTSPLSQKVGPDLAIAEQAIIALRNEALGTNWLPAPQKASLAALLLDHVTAAEASSSVKAMLAREKVLRAQGRGHGTLFADGAPGGQCRMIFSTIHK